MHFYNDAKERENDKKQSEKMGEYENPENGCPKCARHRVMIGADKKHRCEKCGFCIEENDYDAEFIAYMR